MFELLFFIKFFTAIIFILIIAYLSEKISPKFAGILSGFPTGTAITLFFFALENGTNFASISAIYNLVGMLALQTMIYLYYRTSDSISALKKYVILISSFISLLAYFAVAYILHLINFNQFSALLIPLCSIPLLIYLFRKIDNHKIEKRIQITKRTIIFRAFIAASIILLVTELARFVGPEWAGLFSAFPTTVFPLMLIIHFTYDTKHVHTFIKHIPQGQGSIVLYSLAVFYFYPLYGVWGGTLIAYTFAGIYLLGYYFYSRFS